MEYLRSTEPESFWASWAVNDKPQVTVYAMSSLDMKYIPEDVHLLVMKGVRPHSLNLMGHVKCVVYNEIHEKDLVHCPENMRFNIIHVININKIDHLPAAEEYHHNGRIKARFGSCIFDW